MVLEVEGLARYFERHGRNDLAQRYLKEAEDLRKAGVPDNFPEKELTKAEITTGLITAMSSMEVEPVGRVLTDTLATAINQEVGRYLRDEISISDILLPSSRVDERVKEVNPRLRASYNKAVSTFYRRNFSSVGLIRKTDFFTFKGRKVGESTIEFFKAALARPLQS